jgi:hypothetical protein
VGNNEYWLLQKHCQTASSRACIVARSPEHYGFDRQLLKAKPRLLHQGFQVCQLVVKVEVCLNLHIESPLFVWQCCCLLLQNCPRQVGRICYMPSRQRLFRLRNNAFCHVGDVLLAPAELVVELDVVESWD